MKYKSREPLSLLSRYGFAVCAQFLFSVSHNNFMKEDTI